MKTKNFISCFILGMMLVMTLGVVSALDLSSSPTSITLNGDDDSDTITVTSDASTFSISSFNSSLTFTDSNSKTSTVSVSINDQTNVTSSVFTLNVTDIASGFLISESTQDLLINGLNDSDTSDTDSISVPVTFRNSFCSNGAKNDFVSTSDDLELDVKIDNLGEGSDDEWLPLDTIEIEVELDNDRDNMDLDDVVFELGLFKDDSSSNVIDDMIWISSDDEEFEVGDIDEGEKEEHVFQFRVDPDFDDGDYKLVVKAYPDGDESDTCVDYSENLEDFGSEDFFADISIDKESDRDKMVVIDESSYPSAINAFCGESVSFSADVWNIGDRDFEDQVKVVLTNNELDLNIEDIILGDLDSGENAKANFLFEVPTDANEGSYQLRMETFYDYDKDDDTYDRNSDDVFLALLNVQGNCDDSSTPSGTASVTATLESGGKAGEDIVINALVTNTGTNTATYTINSAGYSEWASSANTFPNTITLNSGASSNVKITLAVKNDVSGQKVFNIEIVSGSQLVVTQPVSVEIESKSGFFSITGSAISGNAYLWGLGILNIILIIAIIIVVVRLLRK